MVDIVNAFFQQDFKVSALLPSERTKRAGVDFPVLS
jgi:hypothetical protein